MSDQMKVGDICRAKCGAPARYIGFGTCIYISAMCNDLEFDDAKPAEGGEGRLPTISIEAARAANVVMGELNRLTIIAKRDQQRYERAAATEDRVQQLIGLVRAWQHAQPVHTGGCAFAVDYQGRLVRCTCGFDMAREALDNLTDQTLDKMAT